MNAIIKRSPFKITTASRMIENLTPQQAFDLLNQNASAVLVDVRTQMEHAYVGHPIGAVHIPWKEAPGWEITLIL
jgi:rhodanese-related sulfurtransferase